MTVKSVLGCDNTVDENNLFCFVGSQLSNGDCTQAIDLSAFCTNMCEVSKETMKLSSGCKKEISSVRTILAGNKPFYMAKNPCKKALNFVLTPSITTEQIGQIFNHTVDFSTTVDFSEVVINWINFENKKQNTGLTSWNLIDQNWVYFSTINSTTTQNVNNTESVAEYQTLEGEDCEFSQTIFDGKFLLTFSILNNNDISVTSVTSLENFDVEDIQIVEDGLTYCVFVRGIIVMDKISSVYINMSEYSSEYVLKAIEDETNISTMSANICSEQTSSCGCCG